MDTDTLAILAEVAKQAVSGSVEMARLADIANDFIKMAGGSKGVAEMLWAEYHSKDCSPYTRQRIVNMILDAMRHAEKTQDVISPDALGRLTKGDLDELIQQHLRAVVKQADDNISAQKHPVNPFTS